VLDLLIRGADIVDGTGATRFRGDIGVANGRIVAVGDCQREPAQEEIDADGLIACPGFIDLHTHYDAQLFWDPALTPSSLHGVTTLVSGNCGFTVAPLPADDQYLMRLLSRVEGIPIEALERGVPWNWSSTVEYFDAVDRRTSVNIGFLVGHSAVRRSVMGNEATERRATAEEITRMANLTREGLAAGGLGFSSTRSQTHFDGDHDPVPSRWADDEEFLALARVCSEFEGTSLETSPVASTGVLPDSDVDLMVAMSVAAQRPVNWNAMTVSAAERAICEANLDAGTRAAERGARVVAMTIPMPVQVRYSFSSGVFLDALPGWDDLMHAPPSERMARLRDPVERDRLNRLAQQPGPRRDQADWASLTVLEGFTPRTKMYEGAIVGEIARREHKDPFDVLCDIVIEDELQTGLGRIPRELTAADWSAKLNVWRDRRAVLGASDAGAHLDVLGIFNYPTWLLAEVVRRRGLMALEEAVALLTSVPAELYGFHDRGRIAQGTWADLVLFDEQTVGTEPHSTRRDLPGGSGRIFAAATGVEQVIVAGQTIVFRGEPTRHRPGVLLRRGKDTTTPSLSIPHA
jgi:N-acyl-D-aspartate/D-glutamate deacylase